MAQELGRYTSTICRELERTAASECHAEQAQQAYHEGRKASVPTGNLSRLRWRKNFTRRGLQSKSWHVFEGTACQSFPLKPSIDGYTLAD
nr:hypothetical protein [Paenibacillus barcinonensis]